MLACLENVCYSAVIPNKQAKAQMLTKRQLVAAFNKGDLETVCKECRRYGKITKDKSWDEETGHYKGANRVFYIEYKNIEWRFEMLNGEITRTSMTVKEKQK